MKKLIAILATFAILVVNLSAQNQAIFIREFTAPDPTGQFHAGNTAQPLNPGMTYQVYQSGNSYYLTCKNCPTTPAPVVVQPQQGCSECVDPEIFYRFLEEQRKTLDVALRYQNQGGGQGGNHDQLTYHQIQLMDQMARQQMRQGRTGLILSSIFGAAQIGMQGWNNWMVRQGMYQSNLSVINNLPGTGTIGNGPQMFPTIPSGSMPNGIPADDPRWNPVQQPGLPNMSTPVHQGPGMYSTIRRL